MIKTRPNLDVLEQLVPLVCEDRPELKQVTFTSATPFQTAETSLAVLKEEITGRISPAISWRPQDSLPRIILCWGKCRVGSTAFANLLGRAGIPSYYQPLKALLRHHLVGDEIPYWHLPTGQDLVLIKETSGPYSLPECLFNPLTTLLRAGFPASRISLVIMEREPDVCLDSWFRKWGHRLGESQILTHFVLSSLNRHRIENIARLFGISPLVFRIEEASRPENMKKYFSGLNLMDLYSPAIFEKWQAVDEAKGSNAALFFPDEPAPFYVPNLHSANRKFHYRRPEIEFVTDRHRRVIEKYRLNQLYAAYRCADLSQKNWPDKIAS
ncbi:MAG: hypothetical protein H8E39_06230 [Alphaproteobacteria bacterium]|nr:hypothetical protein [Alphaproteobacteria bacterium]